MEAPETKPLIGTDIPWSFVEGEFFTVDDFSPLATVADDGRVTGPPAPMPYGLLTVNSPVLNQPARMPVNHREDFLNFWDITNSGGVGEGQQLIVTYLPYRGFLGPLLRLFMPVLHLEVFPKSVVDEQLGVLPADPKERHAFARETFLFFDRCLRCDSKLWSFATRCARCRRPRLGRGYPA